jgi:hypothetical protein
MAICDCHYKRQNYESKAEYICADNACTKRIHNPVLMECLNWQDIHKDIADERSRTEACQCTPAGFALVNILTNVKKSEAACPNQQRKINLAN